MKNIKHAVSGMSINSIMVLSLLWLTATVSLLFIFVIAVQNTFASLDCFSVRKLEDYARAWATQAAAVSYGLETDFTESLPDGNPPFDGGFFAIGRMDADTLDPLRLRTFSDKGALALSGAGLISLSRYGDESGNVFETSGGLKDMLVVVSPVNGRSSVGEDYLFSFVPKSGIYESSASLKRMMLLAVAAAVALAFALAYILNRLLTKRIISLTAEASSINPEMPLMLSSTGIREIDELSCVLSHMSMDAQRNAARMSTIVDLVDIPMGAFEILPGGQRVFLTDSLFRLLEIPHAEGDSHYIACSVFEESLPDLRLQEREDSFQLDFEWRGQHSGKELWLRIRTSRRESHIYGTIMDISDEIRQKKRLEYERNYDPLTNLLNRNAYPARMKELIASATDKKGIMLFGDLDNLKVINDTFGHDMGDRYIQMAARAFFGFEQLGGIVARISGDEFVVYMHGKASKQELRKLSNKVLAEIRDTSMTMPDGSVQKVRVSVGIAYYPDDGSDVEELISMADFAMYEIKHSQKGSTNEFDSVSFERNSYLLMKPNALDLLIEQRRTKMAFQPIVDVRTGDIFGFEALMRPQMREFSSPGEVLSIARSQAKLYQLERLTIHSVFERVASERETLNGIKVFFNSIPNQRLSAEDSSELLAMLEDMDVCFVVEITEEEQSTTDVLEEKVTWARGHGFSLALDDYGSGYNSDITLLTITPDFIKVDMSIIRNINEDKNRQLLLKKIVDYAALYEMKIIAEGVETRDELDAVIMLGVDYVQGYYLGRPQYSLITAIPDYVRAELLEIYGRRFEWGLFGDNQQV